MERHYAFYCDDDDDNDDPNRKDNTCVCMRCDDELLRRADGNNNIYEEYGTIKQAVQKGYSVARSGLFPMQEDVRLEKFRGFYPKMPPAGPLRTPQELSLGQLQTRLALRPTDPDEPTEPLEPLGRQTAVPALEQHRGVDSRADALATWLQTWASRAASKLTRRPSEKDGDVCGMRWSAASGLDT